MNNKEIKTILLKKRNVILLTITSISVVILTLGLGLGLGLKNETTKETEYKYEIPMKQKEDFGLAARNYYEEREKWNLTYSDDVANAKFINIPNKIKARTKAKMMYHMLVYSFADGDGDGIGDLWGAYKKLWYLDKLNIDSVWLSPIHIAPSFHGYDVIDYTSVSSDLGGMKAFDAFLREAHKLGIKVYLDMVFNHTSAKHPWFLSALDDPTSKYHQYYTFGNNENTTVQSLGYGIGNEKFFSSFEWHGMADLRFENQNVFNELKNVIKFWIKKGVDGFRFDAFKHFLEDHEINTASPYYPGGLAEVFAELKKSANEMATQIGRKNNEIQFIGEGLGVSNNQVLSYANYDSPTQKKYLPALDGAYDATYWSNPGKNWTVIETKEAEYINTYASELQEMAQRTSNQREIAWMPYLDNHDSQRWIERVRYYLSNQSRTSQDDLNDNDKSLLKSSLLTMSMIQGRPIIYQGDELGYHGRKGSKEDINIREPLSWNDGSEIDFAQYRRYGFGVDDSIRIHLNESIDVGTIEDNLSDPNSILNHLLKYLRIRGDYTWLSSPDSRVQPLQTISGLIQRDGGIRTKANSNEKIVFIGTNAFDILNNQPTTDRTTTYDLSAYVHNKNVQVLFKSKDVTYQNQKAVVPITGVIVLRIT